MGLSRGTLGPWAGFQATAPPLRPPVLYLDSPCCTGGGWGGNGMGIICALFKEGPGQEGAGDPVGRELGGLPDLGSWAGRRMLQGYS